ncbi:MAG: glycosyl transferase family protein [Bryobacteraceae bacterium]|nr:glycosyl transferase family protein [Bryobacteraceae bacterium]
MTALGVLDGVVVAILPPLAAYLLVSGLDDLFVTCVALWGRRRPVAASLDPAVEQRPVAILLPLWHEAAVVEQMVEHNLAAIDYQTFVIFAGAYPNDTETLASLRRLEQRYARVSVALCPHDGPTSKADCLNWIYQRLLLYEEEHGVRFGTIVTHDAEDLIHPRSLRWLNQLCRDYDMVQIPVLALPTPWYELTHGVYCDEFAQYQIQDAQARQRLGGFMPSNGVGTGYRREALEKLAGAEANCIFDPRSLTEDYENGIRLHRLGCRQLFFPVRMEGDAPVATREYFPRTFDSARRQRTRWVTGNALQAWERHGWFGGLRQVYWLWRDRKGLLGNPVSVLSNLLLVYGAATWVWAEAAGGRWSLAGAQVGWAPWVTLWLQVVALIARGWCSAFVYGWRFALGVPVRAVWANAINFLAAAGAVWRFVSAKIRHEPLRWVKTEHVYPSRVALADHKRPLTEWLVGEGCLTAEEAQGASLEELLEAGTLAEEDLCRAEGMRAGLAAVHVPAGRMHRGVVRALPAAVMRKHGVVPYEVEGGVLLLAASAAPSEAALREIRRHTRLAVRVSLVTGSNFEMLVRAAA